MNTALHDGGFVELAAASNFSFLHGASHPEELVITAAALGSPGLAVCDRNTLAGVVRAHLAGKQVGIGTAVGCRLQFRDGSPDVLAWPTDRAAYGRLCRLLTTGNLRGEKDDCRLDLADLAAWSEGLVLAIVAESGTDAAIARAAGLLRDADEPLRLAVSRPYGPHDQRAILRWAALCRRLRLRPLATNLPLYHAPERRPLQDVLTAVREHTTVEAAGRLLAANAERHLKSPAEMARLFAALPEAVGESVRVMDSLAFSLDELRYEYPEEPTDPGRTPQETLVRLTRDGAARRYPGGVPDKVAKLLAHELALIEGLDYAPYFITVYDVVRFARDRGILAQGRGSAANSAVCFCLGVTEVDPDRSDLLFERFISPERREPPDIDVDFEHERREEVIQYVYEKYGRDRAGIAATVITYRARSAAREVGKALGLTEDAVGALAGSIWGWSAEGVGERDAARAGLDPADRRIAHLVRLTREIAGFPRHLSQHVGGFVITRGRLDELVPVVKAAMDGRTNIEWDKDDLDSLGILKIDVLALGMLTCVRKAFALLAEHYGDDFEPGGDGGGMHPPFSVPAAPPPASPPRPTPLHARQPDTPSLAEPIGAGALSARSDPIDREDIAPDSNVFACPPSSASLPPSGTRGRCAPAAPACEPDAISGRLDSTPGAVPAARGADAALPSTVSPRNVILTAFAREPDDPSESSEPPAASPTIPDPARKAPPDACCGGAESPISEATPAVPPDQPRSQTPPAAGAPGETSLWAALPDHLAALHHQPLRPASRPGDTAAVPGDRISPSQDAALPADQISPSPEAVTPDQTAPSPDVALPADQTTPSTDAALSADQASPSPGAALPADQISPSPDVALSEDQISPPPDAALPTDQISPSPDALKALPADQTSPSPDAAPPPDQISPSADPATPDRTRPHPAPPDPPGVPQYKSWPVTLATIPADDPEVYDMICRADTLGVFQIESRAQMTMLPRLRPRTFYDLVIEVAIVRPGPIQGDMVHPYLRRRQGREPVAYPSKELEEVLAKTLGVPLFQEQAMRIAIVAAGFTPSEADQLRRAMATFKKVGTIGTFQQKMIDGMKQRGYDPAFAERCFRQIEGFGEYGFPESHAASFALLVYASCWLKCHYPDVFCAALLNSQPMGFYAPAQIVRDARLHGVDVRPVDINRSDWDCTLEHGPRAADRLDRAHAEMAGAIRSRCAVRLGLRQVKGLNEDEMRRLVARRGAGYDTVRDVWLRTGLPRARIERLADADAFGSIGLSRRDALWAARGLDRVGRAEDLPLFAAAHTADLQREAAADLPPMPPGEEVINDYRFLSLSLKAHPARFVRRALEAEGVVPAQTLVPATSGRRLVVAGLVLVRQRPGSAKGVIFMTVEDETGIANVIVWPKVFEAHRPVVLGARFIKVTGRVQAQDGVVHLVAERLEDRTALLAALTEDVGDWDALDRADEVRRPSVDLRTAVKPRSRLARLIAEAPELRGEAARMLASHRAIAASVAAHRDAAAAIDAGRREPPADPDHGPQPAPAATWGTARSAARDMSNLGETIRNSGRTRRALPKGRNFQ